MRKKIGRHPVRNLTLLLELDQRELQLVKEKLTIAFVMETLKKKAPRVTKDLVASACSFLPIEYTA